MGRDHVTTALPGSVGLRSEHPGITRAMRLSMSWDPWPCPVATLAFSLTAQPRRGRLEPRARSTPGCPPAFVSPRATAPRTQASGSGCARRVGGIGAEHRAQPLLGQVAAPQRRPCPREPASAVATRVASGGTSAPTAMVCRQRPSVAYLSLSRENRLCASDATAGLAFSPRCQPTNPRRALFDVLFLIAGDSAVLMALPACRHRYKG